MQILNDLQINGWSDYDMIKAGVFESGLKFRLIKIIIILVRKLIWYFENIFIVIEKEWICICGD